MAAPSSSSPYKRSRGAAASPPPPPVERAPEEAFAGDFGRVPVTVLRAEVLDGLPCADAAALAQTGRFGARVAAEARDVCAAHTAWYDKALRDLSDYVDLLFAHLVRTLGTATWVGTGIGAWVMPPYAVAALSATWDAIGGCVALRSAADVTSVCPQTVPEVRDQVNAILDQLRGELRSFGGGERTPYLIDATLGPTVPRSLALQRVFAVVRYNRLSEPRPTDAGAAQRLADALHAGALAPADLRKALAQAVTRAVTMNAWSSTGISMAQNPAAMQWRQAGEAVDVDAVIAATGIEPASLAWIDDAAHIAAATTDDATLAEARRFLLAR